MGEGTRRYEGGGGGGKGFVGGGTEREGRDGDEGRHDGWGKTVKEEGFEDGVGEGRRVAGR